MLEQIIQIGLELRKTINTLADDTQLKKTDFLYAKDEVVTPWGTSCWPWKVRRLGVPGGKCPPPPGAKDGIRCY